jgi:hypothetical protein
MDRLQILRQLQLHRAGRNVKHPVTYLNLSRIEYERDEEPGPAADKLIVRCDIDGPPWADVKAGASSVFIAASPPFASFATILQCRLGRSHVRRQVRSGARS